MKLIFVALLFANVFLLGLGQGWFGVVPSQIGVSADAKAPLEIKPASIIFAQSSR